MALSRIEKIKLQKQIKEKIQSIKGDDSLSRIAKVKLQKEIRSAFEQLKKKVEFSETAPENEKLQKLIAGDYNSLEPAEFLAMVKEIVEEIDNLDPVKPPVVEYVRLKKKSGAITESAQAALFDLMDADDPAEDKEMDKAVNE